MSTIATLVVKITGDAKAFNQTAKGVGQSAAQIGKSATRAGLGLTAGLTLPIVALGVKATSMASDLVESQNKVGVVFGENQDIVREFAKTSAENLGISEQAALEAAGTYGNLFTAMGLTGEKSAEMSVDLVTLAADLASFNNLTPDEVLLKLQSGLTGMGVPLKSVGIDLDAVATRLKAVELKLVDANGEVTKAGLLQARYAIFMEQSVNAQGDFARTSEDLANATRIAKAQLANMTAEIGIQLLPIALRLVTIIRDVVAWFMNLSPGVKTAILVFLGIVAVIGPLLLIFGVLASAIGAIIPIIAAVAGVITFPLIAIILGVIAVIALLVAAWKNNWGGIQEKTRAVVAFISGILSKFWEGLKAIFAVGFEFLKIIFDAWSAAFRGDWTTFGEKVREVWDKAWALIVTAVQGAWDLIKTIVSNLVKNVISFIVDTDWLEVGMNIIRGIASGITSGISFIADAARNAAQAALDAAKGFLGISSDSKAFMELGAAAAGGFGNEFMKVMAKFQPAMSLSMAGDVGSVSAGVSMPAVAGVKPKATSVISINYAPMFPRDNEELIARELAPAIRRVLHQVGEDG